MNPEKPNRFNENSLALATGHSNIHKHIGNKSGVVNIDRWLIKASLRFINRSVLQRRWKATPARILACLFPLSLSLFSSLPPRGRLYALEIQRPVLMSPSPSLSTYLLSTDASQYAHYVFNTIKQKQSTGKINFEVSDLFAYLCFWRGCGGMKGDSFRRFSSMSVIQITNEADFLPWIDCFNHFSNNEEWMAYILYYTKISINNFINRSWSLIKLEIFMIYRSLLALRRYWVF